MKTIRATKVKEPFSQELFEEGVRGASSDGAALIEGFLPSGFVKAITNELQYARFTLATPYNAAQVVETYAKVSEEDRETGLRAVLGHIALIVRGQTRHMASEFPVLSAWEPNDVAVQRYEKQQGISPHRDLKRDIGIIALFSVQGQGLFALHEKREYPPMQEPWLLSAGDAVLLRGTGLNPNIEGPAGIFHSVVGASEEPRISIGLRNRVG